MRCSYQPRACQRTSGGSSTVRTEKMVYIHGNLRLVDKLQDMDYAEEVIQWAPEHKEALERLWGIGRPSISS